MQQLSSSNYKYVNVKFRGDDTAFVMPRSTGDNLMRYLAKSDVPSKHVTLTDVNGHKRTVHSSEIISTEPAYEAALLDDERQARLDELRAETHSTSYQSKKCKGVRSIQLEISKRMKREHGKDWPKAFRDRTLREVYRLEILDENTGAWCDSWGGTCVCHDANAKKGGTWDDIFPGSLETLKGEA